MCLDECARYVYEAYFLDVNVALQIQYFILLSAWQSGLARVNY